MKQPQMKARFLTVFYALAGQLVPGGTPFGLVDHDEGEAPPEDGDAQAPEPSREPEQPIH